MKTASPPQARSWPEVVADLVEARATAALAGKRVEASAERTESTTTFANPDGSYTTEVNTAPVRVRRDGQWLPVELTLEQGADGGVRAKNHPRDLVLAGKTDTGGVHDVAVVHHGEAIVALRWEGTLPQPRLDGADATYSDVRPGVDLVVRATRTGFESFFVLRERPREAERFEMRLRLSNVVLRHGEHGNAELVDGNGSVVGAIPAADMWDARGSQNRVRVENQSWTVGADGEARLGLEPAPGFFADPSVRYPVTIDPAVSLDTSFDTFTRSDITSVDQSARTELRIGSPDAGVTKARSYLNFDVARFQGKRIIDAKLSLYAIHSAGCTERNWEVWDSPPVSTSTRWSNQPNPTWRVATSSSTKGGGAGCPAAWVDAGVKSLVQEWAADRLSTGAVMLKAASETDSAGYKEFSSAEGAHVPHLDVTYNTTPGATSDHAISDRSDIGGTVVTRSLTPTLAVRPNDVDGDEQAAVFYVYEGNTIIASKVVDDVPAGEMARWTVPSGVLIDGRSYRFRATSYDGFDIADDSWMVVRSQHSPDMVAQAEDCGYDNNIQMEVAQANGSRCQQYFPWPTGDGHHLLRARHSHRVIHNVRCGTAEGNDVHQYDIEHTDCQKWRMDRQSDGVYEFTVKNVDKVMSHECDLDEGSELAIRQRGEDTCGRWLLDPTPANGAEVRWFPFKVDTSAPAPVDPGKVQYAYDGAGRLVGVSDRNGESARFGYDEVGNTRSIQPFPSQHVSVFSVVPERAAPGATVTVTGTGFSPTAADNTVRFGTATATVTGATATQLAVVVPAGAASGPLAVTTSGGTANSPRPFTVTVHPGAPTISAVSPAHAATGDTVTITGTGFDPVPERNTVVINRTRARVTAATATTLTVTVPPATGSGPVAVRTGAETATSAADLIVVPRPYSAVDLGNSVDLVVDGPGKSVTIPAGKIALLRFSGVKGQRLNLGLTGSTISTVFDIAGFSAYGAPFARDQYSRPWNSNNFAGGLRMPVLPTDGTYQIAIDPRDAGTGAITATLSTPVTGNLQLGGTPTAVTFDREGRHAELTFTATAGQRLGIGLTDMSVPGDAVTAALFGPEGTPVLWDEPAYDRLVAPKGADIDYVAQRTGTHTLVLNSTSGRTGSVKVTGSLPAEVGSLTVGSAKTVAIDRAGQDAVATFAGTAGQRLGLTITDYTFQYALRVRVLRPDGRELVDVERSTAFVDFDPLPETGTYQVVLSPNSSTGSARIRLAERSNAGSITVGGSAKNVSIGTTGGSVETSFTASAGQRISLGVTNSTFGDNGIRVTVTNPEGVVVSNRTVPTGGSTDFATATAGTYRMIVSPLSFGTGSATLTLSEQINAGTLTRNTDKTVTIGRVGQSVRMTYAGTAGQNLAITSSNVTFAYKPRVTVYTPDGTVLIDAHNTNTVAIPTLPATGAYEFVISPFSSSGSATFRLTTRTTTSSSDTQAVAPAAEGRGGPVTALGGQPHTSPHPTVASAQPVGREAEAWTPSPENLSGAGWSTDRPAATDSPAAPSAPEGTTAVSARVLTLDGRGLPGVSVSIGDHRARTGRDGWFLLADVPAGRQVLRVDGSTAGSSDRRFGLHDIGIDVADGKTTALPFPVWLSRLDTRHAVAFPSPTTDDVVITTPAIPGLEVHLPPGAVVRDADGDVVTELGITAIPVDRPPFPLPQSNVPVYFTVQPGSAYLFPTGARIVYPNYTHEAPGAVMNFWHYEPEGRGWFVYGTGKVSDDGTKVVPDPGVEVYRFTGAMLITPGIPAPPERAPAPGSTSRGGDPVDLATGLLVDEQTDLVLDDVMPIGLTRTYRQGDPGSRAFGIGANFEYGAYLTSRQYWTEADLVLPDGGQVHYRRISPGGTGRDEFKSGVFQADPTPTRFNGSVMAWNGNGWDLRLRDGTVWVFGDEAPLQEIRDRHGNTTTFTRAPAPADSDGVVRDRGPITQITSPNGKWIKLGYDSANRVTSAEDILGRTVRYTYHASGHLATVTDPAGGVTAYTYADGNLHTITDARGTTYLTNEYDEEGRVAKQTLADGGTYIFAYTAAADGTVSQTRLTDPRGHVRRVTFNDKGYATSETQAQGTPAERTWSIERDQRTNQVTAYVDPLGRRTALAYDANGALASRTEMAGTPTARTTAYAHDGPYDQLRRLTDPLGNTLALDYDSTGTLTKVTDPEGRTVEFRHNTAGQVTSRVDAAGHTTSYGYSLGEQVSDTDPLGRIGRRSIDPAGRTIAVTDPQGNRTMVVYDPVDRIRSVTDPLGHVTTYGYDANGNLTGLTDARNNTVSFGYDDADRLRIRTDALGRSETLSYDLNGNVVSETSRAGRVTTYAYDELDRRTTTRFGVTGDQAESTVTQGYDTGDRVTTIRDSAAGTITMTPDAFDQILRVDSPQGRVDYTYDAAGRRTSMTVEGGPEVTYTYNRAGQLTRAGEVTLGYDRLGRQDSVTMPGELRQSYTYDAADQITDIAYRHGSTVLGNLAYTYDAAGRTTTVGGSFARTDIPDPLGPVTYDAANRISGGHSYDPDGNLTADGTHVYSWNARGQLLSVTGPDTTATFAYDGQGRRTTRTVGTTATTYLHDGANPVRESTSGRTTELTTGGLDRYFTRDTGTDRRVILTDRLGSTVALADTTGRITAEYTYQPFGKTSVTGDDQGNSHRFTGREDDGTGLYAYRARYYDPDTARFLSEDPLGHASGEANLYAYVSNAPTMLVDPMGTKPRNPGGGGTAVGDCVPDPKGGGNYTTYSQLRRAQARDAHHIIQDAAVKGIEGYSRYRAPAIQLQGPSNLAGTPHQKATAVQKLPGGGTYGAERDIAYRALREAGLSEDDAMRAVEGADEYFMGNLCLGLDSPTNIPGDRAKGDK
ncbi:RHS repeat-associated core domain-containing protein [Saccharothrix xinjiangensis]|uniref:RHS repeat-associated core domain-containing protein n=1 Tax=Saccharothrix xinjiangensis TaxID=204798 RepID=A0ABV9XVB3_9PSEU